MHREELLVAGLQADGPDIGDERIRTRRDGMLADFPGLDQLHGRGDAGKAVIDDLAGPVLHLLAKRSGPERAAAAAGIFGCAIGKGVHDLSAIPHRKMKMEEFGIA